MWSYLLLQKWNIHVTLGFKRLQRTSAEARFFILKGILLIKLLPLTIASLYALQPQSELLIPRIKFILDRLTVAQLVKKHFAFYETRKVIPVFTIARHWFLFSSKLIQ